MNDLKQLLLEAPEGQLDPSMFPLIQKWDDEPTAIQILEVLDHCVHAGLASGFVITVLETMVEAALAGENLTRAELVSKAVWRLDKV